MTLRGAPKLNDLSRELEAEHNSSMQTNHTRPPTKKHTHAIGVDLSFFSSGELCVSFVRDDCDLYRCKGPPRLCVGQILCFARLRYEKWTSLTSDSRFETFAAMRNLIGGLCFLMGAAPDKPLPSRYWSRYYYNYFIRLYARIGREKILASSNSNRGS